MAYTPRLVEPDGKHPGEEVDYAPDFTDWLVGAETISSISSCTAAAGITLGTGAKAPAISGTSIVFWLSGGDTGTAYDIVIVFVTSGGRTLVADIRITVTDPTP